MVPKARDLREHDPPGTYDDIPEILILCLRRPKPAESSPAANGAQRNYRPVERFVICTAYSLMSPKFQEKQFPPFLVVLKAKFHRFSMNVRSFIPLA